MKNFSARGGPALDWQKLNKSEARELLDKVSFKTFFHNLEFHEFLEKEFRWIKFEYYLYKDEVILPLAKFKVFGKEKLVSLPFCEYGGPLPLKGDININEFERDVLEKFKNIKIKFHPEVLESYEVKPRKHLRGLFSNILTSWIVDLDKKNEEEIRSSFRKTLRHSIRNAEKQGLEIKKCSNLKELKQFYNLYLANLKRKKTIPYPFSIFEFLFNNLNIEILLAVYKNKIIAGDLFVYYDKFVHYLFNASDYKYRNLGPSYLILWSKIKSLCGQNKIFDLGAAPRGLDLEIFKKGWRGKEYPIYQIGIKREDESLRSSKIIRNLWRLLPNFVIKKLSPYLIKYRI